MFFPENSAIAHLAKGLDFAHRALPIGLGARAVAGTILD